MITVMAVPNIFSAVSNIRLRSSASSFGSLLQNARMQAVRDDRSYTVRSTQLAGSNVSVAYIDLNGNSSLDAGEPLVQFGGSARLVTSGNPSTSTLSLGFTPQAATVLPSFNARGTPCAASGTACNTYVGSSAVGFLYFLSDQRPVGGPTWAAISVSPGGRIRVWTWNGVAWR